MKKSRMVIKVWRVDDKSQQSYFDCVSFIRACLKHEMTKWRNGEITILNSKKKITPSILSCPVVISLPSMNRQNSAQHADAKPHKSCCAIAVIAVTCSFSFQGSLLSPGTSQFCQFLGRYSIETWPSLGQKNPLINALFRTTPSILLHCLGQRTKCTPSYFKAIYWQLQSRNFHVIVIAFVCK